MSILIPATPLLDIERGLLKLEKVAIRCRAERAKKQLPKRPLVLMINSLHLLQDDEVGGALLEMLQQKAEAWAESGIITMILNRYSVPVSADTVMTIGYTKGYNSTQPAWNWFLYLISLAQTLLLRY